MPSKRCTWPPGACMALPWTCPSAARGSATAESLPSSSISFIERRSSSTGRIDGDKIILVGHSFGATAVATALGEGAPALGGVLLDPTAIGRGLSESLKRIAVPVMVIGADEDIRPARNRGPFYRFIPRAVGEISIRDTVHEDAQYPNQLTLRTFEDDPDDTEEAQIRFVSALTASAFGLAATGDIDYAWNSFENAFKNGIFFNARRK